MRKWLCCWAGWIAIANVDVPLRASSGPALQIDVYNLAHVGSKDLARAEQEAAVIFAEAGIITNWSDSSVPNPQELVIDFSANGASSGQCAGANQIEKITLQLLRATPRSIRPAALGYALPCARFGVTVTVFVDRCEEVLYHALTSFPKILAHTMAHEIGHVLLSSNEHSDTGIMRGLWTMTDWRTAAVGHMRFLPGQAQRMRQRLSLLDQASVNRPFTPDTEQSNLQPIAPESQSRHRALLSASLSAQNPEYLK